MELKQPIRSLELEIRQMERLWIEALLQSNSQTFDALLSQDFIYTDSLGRVSDRNFCLSIIAANEVHIESITLLDEAIRIYHETAVVTGCILLRAEHKGQDISGPTRFTRVWVKDQGRWQAVALQMTQPFHL